LGEDGLVRRILLTALVPLFWAMPTSGQQPGGPQPDNRLNVFFDCRGRECILTQTFFRTEITWVNWVRNREDSDVHVIITDERTGSGGKQFQLDFLGRERLEGSNDQLFFRSFGTDVQQEELDGLTTTLAIGLARYANMSGFRDFVVFEPLAADQIDPDARVRGRQEVDDPWNLWVFNVAASGDLAFTDLRDTENISGDLSASRTTPDWKVVIGGGWDRSVTATELKDSSIVESEQIDWTVGTQIVHAVADHWSLGVTTAFSKSPKINQKLRIDLRPALEFSFFPYVEATRRTLTFQYAVGPTYLEYENQTVFGKLDETRFLESLQLRYSHRQPWGDGSASATVSHILNDVSKRNVSLRGTVSFRIVRGLSLNVGANASWVSDQIYLSAKGETDEEILLNLITRASDLNKGFNVGFSYRFGSIFNNVVNNRFVGGPGG